MPRVFIGIMPLSTWQESPNLHVWIPRNLSLPPQPYAIRLYISEGTFL